MLTKMIAGVRLVRVLDEVQPDERHDVLDGRLLREEGFDPADDAFCPLARGVVRHATSIAKYPLSSLGMNPLGTLRTSTKSNATTTPKAAKNVRGRSITRPAAAR